MAVTDAQRIRTLQKQVKFLQQRVNPTNSTAIAALEVAVAAIEAMLDIGDDDGMMRWGPSGKANAINADSPTGEAGYDREEDRTFVGGQVLMSTLGDAATILAARQEVDPSSTTGFPTNQGMVRIDIAAIDKNGNYIYQANGADKAFLCLNSYYHLPNISNSGADGWGSWRLQCIRANHSSLAKPPLDMLYVSGEDNGDGTSGRVEAYRYNAAGTKFTKVLSP